MLFNPLTVYMFFFHDYLLIIDSVYNQHIIIISLSCNYQVSVYLLHTVLSLQ